MSEYEDLRIVKASPDDLPLLLEFICELAKGTVDSLERAAQLR
jgi:hypothetical protein